ncbi:hypothetical protein ACTMU2_12680 [Cupriavidus basilensis]
MNLSDIPVVSATATTTTTTCRTAGVGCGVRALHGACADGQVEIAGDAEHPSDLGRLCVKSSALGETVDLRGRLLHPECAGAGGTLERRCRGTTRSTPWRRASRASSANFTAPMPSHCMCRPVADRGLLRCQQADEGLHRHRQHRHQLAAVHVVGRGRPQARVRRETTDAWQLLKDLELADLVVLVGSNTAWCHPILFFIASVLVRPKEARPGDEDRRHRPAPRSRLRNVADLHPAGTPRHRCLAVASGLLSYLARRRQGGCCRILDGKHGRAR